MSQLLITLLTGIALLLIGLDLFHAWWVRRRYASWEAAVERDAEGVRQGCQAFTVGHGETALLLVHGLGGSPAVYQRLAPALAQRGCTCRAMRLPGFGMRLEHTGRNCDARWRKAVLGELEALRRTHRQVGVVAHSLGGAIALDCLAAHPETADALVLLAPLLRVSDALLPWVSGDTWYWILDNTLCFTDRFKVPGAPSLKDPAAWAQLKADAFVPRALFQHLFRLVARNRRRAHRLRVPLLLFLAEDDATVDNGVARQFYRQCVSVRKQVKYLHGAGHIFPMEERYEEVAEAIARFLKEESPNSKEPLAFLFAKRAALQ